MKYYSIKQINKKSKEVRYPSIWISSNKGSDFCGDYSAEIRFYRTNTSLWCTTNFRIVEEMLVDGGPQWYNSSTDNPSFELESKEFDYEIVEFEVGL